MIEISHDFDPGASPESLDKVAVLRTDAARFVTIWSAAILKCAAMARAGRSLRFRERKTFR